MADEADLVARIHRGQTEAVAEFVELRRRQLAAFVERQMSGALRAQLEPDDIIQEVLLSAVRSSSDLFTRDRDPFSVLCHLAEQRIIDAYRRHVAAQKRSTEHEVRLDGPPAAGQSAALIDLLVVSMTTPSQAFSRQQKEHRLQQALAGLPEQQREVLRLRYVEGLPTKEIAQRMGKTDGAIRVLLTRLLGKLQVMLGTE